MLSNQHFSNNDSSSGFYFIALRKETWFSSLFFQFNYLFIDIFVRKCLIYFITMCFVIYTFFISYCSLFVCLLKAISISFYVFIVTEEHSVALKTIKIDSMQKEIENTSHLADFFPKNKIEEKILPNMLLFYSILFWNATFYT